MSYILSNMLATQLHVTLPYNVTVHTFMLLKLTLAVLGGRGRKSNLFFMVLEQFSPDILIYYTAHFQRENTKYSYAL